MSASEKVKRSTQKGAFSLDHGDWLIGQSHTPKQAICLRRRGVDPFRFDTPTTGFLTFPVVLQGEVGSDADLYTAVAGRHDDDGPVVVTGHGYPGEADRFVWTGTVAQFRKVWKGD